MPPRIGTAWLAVAMLVLALPTPARAVCTLDPNDPFEPHASMPRGPFAGRCLDTSEQRSIRILSPDQAAAYGLTPDRDRIFVIANLRHAGRYWVAEIDPQAVEEVILQVEYFPAVVPAAHTQLCFRFRPGQAPRLVPQIGPADSGATRLTDLVYSVEAAYLIHGEPYDLVKGTQDHYATAYRFVSLETRYRQMVLHEHHRVEQIRLKLAPEERRRLLIRVLRDSDAAQLGRMYDTLGLNCTTELIRAIDGSVTYSAWQHVLAAATFFLDGVPTQCRGQLALRGLLPDRDEPPLPDLEKDRSLPFLAPAAARP
jgi:hypothetical protein